MDDDQLHAIRELLDQHHLRVPLISPYFNFTKNEDRAADGVRKAQLALHQARILGAEGIRTFTGGDRSRDAAPEQWDRCVSILQDLCDESHEDGIHWCLHTHDWNLVDNVPGCRRLRDLVGRPNLTILYKPAYLLPQDHLVPVSIKKIGPGGPSNCELVVRMTAGFKTAPLTIVVK